MMKITSAIAADMSPPVAASALAPRFALRVALIIGVVAFGDFLFFGHSIGISVFLFCVAVAAALLIAQPRSKAAAIATAMLALALLPLVEDVSLLAVCIAFIAFALFAAFIAAGARFDGLARSAGALLAIGAFQFIPDLVRAHRSGGITVKPSELTSWLLPVGAGLIFLVLFGVANPLVDKWIAAFNPLRLLEHLDVGRVIFWVFLLALVWPFVLPRIRKSWRVFAPPIGVQGGGLVMGLFTPQSILRSLILFNLMFAVQTAMDIAYLWGGVALPEGMTYANYAHRGAYPLIATALLAAGFVLLAMPARHQPRPLIRWLVLAFILQNVMLVISSMLRLDLYIETYSLTLLRVAAFVWMGLVAFGLALILARIVFGKSNAWLIGANLIALGATLYVCAFLDFRGMVASYNVTQHLERGTKIDRYYIYTLGPAALPTLYRLRGDDWATNNGGTHPEWLTYQIACLASQHRQHMAGWRAWTFHGHRLLNYLDANPSAKPQPTEEGSPCAEEFS
jgi:hypothetical protein